MADNINADTRNTVRKSPSPPRMTSGLQSRNPNLSPGIRFAEPADVDRLGIVQYAGFATTDEYEYMYPDHQNNIKNHIDSERLVAIDAIERSRQFVLRGPRTHTVCQVIEAEYNKDEIESAEAKALDIAAGSSSDTDPFGQERKVVAGVAVWEFPRELMSGRDMRCSSDEPCPDIQLPETFNRDEDNGQLLKVRGAGNIAAYYNEDASDIVLSRLVVHPLYRRKGFAKALVEFGMEIAKADQCRIRVLAAADGIAFYESLGFEKLQGPESEWTLEGTPDSPKGTSGCLMTYTPGMAES